MTPAIKFSVLLPTRNRLELLGYAIQSVLRQEYEDWEIIVSDNNSYQDISGYIDSLGDPRIRYFRTDDFVPVTDNWNNALRYATGDYVIMLGDDDCLMRAFFTTMNDLIARFEQPDLIYTDAYVYGYPGVLPDYPNGYLRRGYNNFFKEQSPFILDEPTASEIMGRSLLLQHGIMFNMQLSVISKAFIESLVGHGTFFQSPYPDYYATVVAFLKSARTVIYQQPVVTIGVSPKSFGAYFFNNNQTDGASFLNNLAALEGADSLKKIILPGSYDYNCRLVAMQTVYSNYQTELDALGLRVGYDAYQKMQIRYVYKSYFVDRVITQTQFKDAQKQLPLKKYRAYANRLALQFGIPGALGPKRASQIAQVVRKLQGRAFTFEGSEWAVSGLQNILDVYDKFVPRHDS